LFAFSIVAISALSLMMSLDFQAMPHASLLAML
jgi:protoheme IX farnesyltransferase